MEIQTMFLVCPARLNTDDTDVCGLPAEVATRYTVTSTDGPLESAKIRCPRGHWFDGPIQFLTTLDVAAVAPSPASLPQL
jgi:hypothetical protein